jgi:hypothetical protein
MYTKMILTGANGKLRRQSTIRHTLIHELLLQVLAKVLMASRCATQLPAFSPRRELRSCEQVAMICFMAQIGW